MTEQISNRQLFISYMETGETEKAIDLWDNEFKKYGSIIKQAFLTVCFYAGLTIVFYLKLNHFI